jgi:hypothetical protein
MRESETEREGERQREREKDRERERKKAVYNKCCESWNTCAVLLYWNTVRTHFLYNATSLERDLEVLP